MRIDEHNSSLAYGLSLYRRGIDSRISKRNEQGSLIILYIAITFVVIALFMLGSRILLLMTEKERYQQALESAAIKASVDLSEIVINDPNFGFISLSDQGAIGRATMAADGEPLPVHSINTIIATTRLGYIIAQETGDEQLKELALRDLRQARESAIRLDAVLERALRAKSNDETNVARDMDGNEVHPYADALGMYEKSLQSFTTANPEGFKLTLGWLKDGGQTITAVPLSNPLNTSKERGRYAKPETTINGCYRAYVDIPVDTQHFSFASVGTEPVLVGASQFVPKSLKTADEELKQQQAFIESSEFIPERNNRYLSSIVKAEAVWQVSNLFTGDTNRSPETINSRACAQPYAIANQPAPAVLIINFVDGLPGNIRSFSDMLADQDLNQASISACTPIMGDYGIDASSQLRGLPINGSAAWAFAVCFHDWLRSNYTLPKIDSVLTTLNQSFSDINQSPRSMFVLEVTADGNVVMSDLLGNPFGTIVVEENQLYLTSGMPVAIGGNNWNIMCRDEVHNLGTIAGGKHAGQPLPGDPINWDTLGSYVNQPFAEAAASRRPKSIVVGGLESINGGIALTGAQLQVTNGERLDRNLRTTSCNNGLAAEILISYPRRPLR